jgi:hypothetical protein
MRYAYPTYIRTINMLARAGSLIGALFSLSFLPEALPLKAVVGIGLAATRVALAVIGRGRTNAHRLEAIPRN